MGDEFERIFVAWEDDEDRYGETWHDSLAEALADFTYAVSGGNGIRSAWMTVVRRG